MKKAIAITIPVLAALCIVQHFTSCEKYVLPAVDVEPDSLLFRTSPDSSTVSVSANVVWKADVSTGQEWVTVSPARGDGDGSLNIKVAASKDSCRTATVTITSETIRRSIFIKQLREEEK